MGLAPRNARFSIRLERGLIERSTATVVIPARSCVAIRSDCGEFVEIFCPAVAKPEELVVIDELTERQFARAGTTTW
jgi:hypothetical protein